MDTTRYNIIFEGKIADGIDPATARENLQKLFKANAATVNRLFSGNRTVLKKDVSADTMKKYQAALGKAGVECIADPILSLAAEPVTQEPSAPAAAPQANNSAAEESGPVDPYAPPKQDAAIRPQVFCRSCGEKIDASASKCPQCGEKQLVGKPKSKVTAALLAIFLGFLGIHRFYLGQWVGVVYLLFGFIAWPIAWVEAIVFLFTSQERWQKKYGNVVGGGVGMIIAAIFLFIVIIGILAAIAVPQYAEYVQRAKVQQTIRDVQPAIDKVTDFASRQGYFPGSNAEAGLAADMSGESLASFVVSEDGIITLTFASESNKELDGSTLLFVPGVAGNTVQWDCSGGTLQKKFRPPDCREGSYSGQQALVTRRWVVADDEITKMRVPSFWKQYAELTEVGGIEYANLQREQYLVVISESKADFSSNVDLFAYNDLLDENFRNATTNMQLKYRGEVEINGLRGLKYEMRGEIDNIKVVYLRVALEGRDHFHQVLFWTIPTQWNKSSKLFEEALLSFNECPDGCGDP